MSSIKANDECMGNLLRKFMLIQVDDVIVSSGKLGPQSK